MDEDDEETEPRKRRMNFTIRPMEIDDLATVFHMGEKVFTAIEVPTLYRTWDQFEVIELFQAEPELCLVAETDDDRIIGFTLGTTIRKNRSAWKYGHLVWLGVEPAHQRKDVSTKLFNHFRDQLIEMGVRMVLVDTEADNLPALHFFRKIGFGNPEEHIYLTLNLAAHRRQIAEKKNNGKAELLRHSKHDV
jgi:ribosomal protein S18 acetylase RimI-like enzyme